MNYIRSKKRGLFMAQQHEDFMRQAIYLANQNVTTNRGGPFGVIVVKENTILAQGTNLVTVTNDPTAHAEIVAIRAACIKLHSFQLTGCTIYSSCEPCPMCLGALLWARPTDLYFAATRHDAANAGFDDTFIYQQMAIPPSQWKIPAAQILQTEALTPFTLWQKAKNKVLY
jgi:guanine deaminase